MKKFLLVLLSVATLSGCATYRTNSGINLSKVDSKAVLSEVEILESSLPESSYKKLGIVEANIKKLTIFDPDPTQEQANTVMAVKAKNMGADAVINTTYKKGVGLTTWGYIKASGEAVKKQ